MHLFSVDMDDLSGKALYQNCIKCEIRQKY